MCVDVLLRAVQLAVGIVAEGFSPRAVSPSAGGWSGLESRRGMCWWRELWAAAAGVTQFYMEVIEDGLHVRRRIRESKIFSRASHKARAVNSFILYGAE